MKHHQEHTITELKPDNTHLVKIPDKMYKQLQEIGKINPYDEEVSPTSVIGFLIRWYEISKNYYPIQQKQHGKKFIHDFLFKNEL